MMSAIYISSYMLMYGEQNKLKLPLALQKGAFVSSEDIWSVWEMLAAGMKCWRGQLTIHRPAMQICYLESPLHNK